MNTVHLTGLICSTLLSELCHLKLCILSKTFSFLLVEAFIVVSHDSAKIFMEDCLFGFRNNDQHVGEDFGDLTKLVLALDELGLAQTLVIINIVSVVSDCEISTLLLG